ncbi:MAG: cadherin-like domain-containing protein, partial [Pirellulales bacterium]|nr:cadherin-like domain-containing protein [Pirellulales bacterium]
VRFTPDADFNGDVTFTYRVSDTNGIQEDGSVTVSVTPVNDPPTGVADTLNVDQNSSNNVLDVLSNDLITPDSGETLTITSVGSTSSGGTVTISSDSFSLNYTPPSNFTGTDTFTYTVSDGTATAQATVTVIVASADDPPTAVDDSFNIIEDDSEAEFDVLANDTRDGDNQEFVLNSVGAPSQGGSARISNDGTQFFYTPAPDFAGTEEVTYTIRDTGGGLAVGTVTFTVAGTNDPPPATDTTVQINRGDGESVALAISDLPDNVDSGETLNFTNLGTPTAGGSVRIDSTTGSILYTPPTGSFTGEDSFTYTVEDGSGLTSSGTVTINVSDFTERDIFLVYETESIGRIGGVVIRGVNVLGEDVEVPLTYRSDNTAVFGDLLPGDYTIRIPAIPFLQNASSPREIPLSSAAEDGDMTIEANLGLLKPEFISLRDWLGSAPSQSLLVAVAPGGSSAFAMPTSETDTVNNVEAELDANGQNLTIRGTDSSGSPIEATVATGSNENVQFRGEQGGLRLLRISVEASDVTFQSAPAASMAAEGEFVPTQTQSSSRPAEAELVEQASTSLSLGRQAEGEQAAVQSATLADVFVPTAQQIDTRTDAAVLPVEGEDLWVGESLLEEDSAENSNGSFDAV